MEKKIKNSTLIPIIVIPVLGIFFGVLVFPAFVDSVETQKDCEDQNIIINETANGVTISISCIPAKDGTVIGNRTVEYVD